MAYLEPDQVRWPPEPEGWSDSELNVDALQVLGRSGMVIELLRRLPYPAVPKTEVYSATWTLSYLCEHWQPEESGHGWRRTPFTMLRLAPFDGPMPPHLISLTFEEAEVGVVWVIDTDRGETLPVTGSIIPAAEEKNKWWLKAKAMTFRDYFDDVYEQISSLVLVPAPAAGNFPQAISKSGDFEFKVLKDLYHEFGWPTGLRKEAFLKAAVPARKAAIEAGIQHLSLYKHEPDANILAGKVNRPEHNKRDDDVEFDPEDVWVDKGNSRRNELADLGIKSAPYIGLGSTSPGSALALAKRVVALPSSLSKVLDTATAVHEDARAIITPPPQLVHTGEKHDEQDAAW
ncbi:hypothetical protein CMUS01_10362 [Colletotrichum musicola]|uniref:Uncharacterized protein n=1 Tax=Colletotrichum musicola TaxID=2175873 RepID=A0A8H6K485_9PEZI|nr:hypothetical protein CMUS01_10362 [Colletotrichum musicola]